MIDRRSLIVGCVASTLAFTGLGLATPAHASLGDGLEAWWNFDDPDNLFHDASGNGNEPTSIVGNPTQGTGIVGSGSLSLAGDGANGEGAIINPNIGAGADFTLSAWIKMDESDAGLHRPRTMMYKQNGTLNTGWYFYTYSSNNRPIANVLNDSGNNFVGAEASNTLPDEVAVNWNHTAFTYDSESEVGSFYINGQLTATETIPDYNPNTGTNLSIGLRTGAEDRGWHGELDELAVWDRVLSQGEIETLAGGAVIPEPGTLALLGVGALALMRRRR